MSENETKDPSQQEPLRFTAAEWSEHRANLANLVESEMRRADNPADMARLIAETFLNHELVRVEKLATLQTEKITVMTFPGSSYRTLSASREIPICDDTSCGVIRPHEHGGDCDTSCGCQDNLGGH